MVAGSLVVLEAYITFLPRSKRLLISWLLLGIYSYLIQRYQIETFSQKI